MLKRLTVVILLGGCTHIHNAPPPGRLDGESLVVYQGARRTLARGDLTNDGLVLRRVDGSIVDENTISKVEKVNHGRGALYGTGIGALTGIALGVLAGYGHESDCSANVCIADSGGDAAAGLALVFGSTGGLVGALAGLMIGSPDVYTVPPTAAGE